MLKDISLCVHDHAWGEYSINVSDKSVLDDSTFQVVNGKGKVVNVVWATMEGATACAELLAEGYLKE